jgi:hypothetical protein
MLEILLRSLRSLKTLCALSNAAKNSPEGRSHDEIYPHRIPTLTPSLGKKNPEKTKNLIPLPTETTTLLYSVSLPLSEHLHMKPIPFLAFIVLTSPLLASPPRYTSEERARARSEAIANSIQSKFVGPRLPTASKSESLADTLNRPTRKKPAPPPPTRNRQVPPPRTYFDGKYFRTADGGVIAQKSGCRPCWMVRAGLHYRR